MVQSCPEASPMKWHQAHTTWFFETFMLRPHLPDYKPFREDFRWLFNSYYNSHGEPIPDKRQRASFSRPSLQQVLAFREHVDRAMEALLQGSMDDETVRLIILGLNHEQQRQELMLTDIKHAFFSNPLHPAYDAFPLVEDLDVSPSKFGWREFGGGLAEIGHSPDFTAPADFCFDNESPRHKVYLEPFQIASRDVTCREYLDFMLDGAYSRAELWLSERWDTLRNQACQAPLYWERCATRPAGVSSRYGAGARFQHCWIRRCAT
jgi:ergothioneine biosynthesis protein EgtB